MSFTTRELINAGESFLVLATVFMSGLLIGFLVCVSVSKPDYVYKNELKTHNPAVETTASNQWGVASWYDYTFTENQETAVPCVLRRGNCYTEDKLFAASRKYERGSQLRVTNLENGKEVEVLVTDYIEHPDRVIDLTSYSFRQIAPLEKGLVEVRIEKIGEKSDY